MKKFITLILLTVILLMLALISCGNGGSQEHQHSYSEKWSYDDKYHYHKATCEHAEETKDKAAHDFGEWAETKAPTVSEAGEKARSCTICKYAQTEAVPPISTPEHTHSYSEKTYEPTCVEDGYKEYVCECGASYRDSYVDALGHNYLENVFAPTCLENGYTEYQCECGASYKDNYVSSLGHSFGNSYHFNDSYHWYKATCQHTDEMNGYEKHTYKESKVEATCTEGGYTQYTCDCGYSFESNLVKPTGHTAIEWDLNQSTLINEQSCEYLCVYASTCEDCSESLTKTEITEKHAYYWAISKPSTCQSDGEKVYICANMGCKQNTPNEITQIQSYRDSEAHIWSMDESNTTESIVAYACNCGASKKSVLSTNTNVDVSKSDFENASEIKLPSATIGFDSGVKENISSSTSVSVSANTLDNTQREEAIYNAGLSSEQLKSLEGKEIYNFTLSTGRGNNISSLGGNATIRIEYTLSNGETTEDIVVWYLGNNKIESKKAIYSESADGKGYITFTTDHFSYYTIAQLTPAMRCEAEGHIENAVNATCIEAGYIACSRCDVVLSTIKPLGHSYQKTVSKENNCFENGIMTLSCVSCNDTYEEIIPSTGHYYVVSDSKESSCVEAGYNTSKCVYCDHSYTVSIPTVDHSFITKVVEPTCKKAGYTENACIGCGYVYTTNPTARTDHKYSDQYQSTARGHYYACVDCGISGEILRHKSSGAPTENNPESCTECGYIITPALAHVHKLTKSYANEPSCVDGGSIEYYVCQCGKWFSDKDAKILITDHESVYLSPKGHVIEVISAKMPTCQEEGYTSGEKCTVCNEILKGLAVIEITDHKYVPRVTAPTCTKSGYTEYKCACGEKYTADETEALGHSYVETVIAPTCTREGEILYRCSRCMFLHLGDRLAALGHRYSNEYTTNEESHYFKCLGCSSYIGKENHIPDYNEATEEHGITCKVCKYQIEDAKDHTHIIVKTTPSEEPTCTRYGNQAYYSCACGAHFLDEECINQVTIIEVLISALGHDLQTINGIPATCTSAGTSDYVICQRCNERSYSYIIPLLGHYYENDICVRCGKEYELECTHQNRTYFEQIEPDCENDGVIAFECNDCRVEIYEYPEKTGHIFNENNECVGCGRPKRQCVEYRYIEINGRILTLYSDGSCVVHTEGIERTATWSYKSEITIEIILKSGEVLYYNLRADSDKCTHAIIRTTRYKASTCIEAGFAEDKCKYCDKIFFQEWKLAPHQPDSANTTCIVCNAHLKICYATIDEGENQYTFYYDKTYENTYFVTDENGESVKEILDTGTWVLDGGIFYLTSDSGEAKELECPHKYYQTMGYVEPTCTSEGLVQKQCTLCDTYIEEPIEKKPHDKDFDDICVNCGDSTPREIFYKCVYEQITFIFYTDKAYKTIYTDKDGEHMYLYTSWYLDNENIIHCDVDKPYRENYYIPYDPSKCGHYESEEIKTVMGCCISTGYVERKCLDCGEIFNDYSDMTYGSHLSLSSSESCIYCGFITPRYNRPSSGTNVEGSIIYSTYIENKGRVFLYDSGTAVMVTVEGNEFVTSVGTYTIDSSFKSKYVSLDRLDVSSFKIFYCEHVNKEVLSYKEGTCSYEGIIKYNCNDCDEDFVVGTGLNRHSYNENKECTSCGVVAPTSLVYIMESDGAVYELYQCDIVLCILVNEITPEIKVNEYFAGAWTASSTTASIKIEYKYSEIRSETIIISCNHENATVTRVEPTCTKAGSETIRCSLCSYNKKTTLPKLGHDEDENGKCTRCTYCSHKNKTYVSSTVGTCKVKSYDTYECNGCSSLVIVRTEYGPHKFVSGVCEYCKKNAELIYTYTYKEFTALLYEGGTMSVVIKDENITEIEKQGTYELNESTGVINATVDGEAMIFQIINGSIKKIADCSHEKSYNDSYSGTCYEITYTEYYCAECEGFSYEIWGFEYHQYDQNDACIYCGVGRESLMIMSDGYGIYFHDGGKCIKYISDIETGVDISRYDGEWALSNGKVVATIENREYTFDLSEVECYHASGKEIERVEPNCLSNGYCVTECLICKQQTKMTLFKVSHLYNQNGLCKMCGTSYAFARTYTDDGYIRYFIDGTCSYYFDEDIAADKDAQARYRGEWEKIGNNLVAYIDGLEYVRENYFYDDCSHSVSLEAGKIEPTCQNEGQEAYFCASCAEYYTVVIPKAEHAYENGVCTECGDTRIEE